MIKFTAMPVRNPALTAEEFVSHHKTVHAKLFMSLPASRQHVRRYVQSHALGVELPGMPPSRYDGITEIWFDDIDGFAAPPSVTAKRRPVTGTFHPVQRILTGPCGAGHRSGSLASASRCMCELGADAKAVGSVTYWTPTEPTSASRAWRPMSLLKTLA
jgi:EthD domain